MKNTLIFRGLLLGGMIIAVGILFNSVLRGGDHNVSPEMVESSAAIGNESHAHVYQTYEWAAQVKEGGRTSFRGLSVTLMSVEEKIPCETNCLRANFSIAHEEVSDTLHNVAVGDAFSFGGVTVKVSQLAPFEAPKGVLRRAVLLFSGLEE